MKISISIFIINNYVLSKMCFLWTSEQQSLQEVGLTGSLQSWHMLSEAW